jgi:hypothetical protein
LHRQPGHGAIRIAAAPHGRAIDVPRVTAADLHAMGSVALTPGRAMESDVPRRDRAKEPVARTRRETGEDWSSESINSSGD